MSLTAPRTRANDRFTPPPQSDYNHPATTRKRTRFFAAVDKNAGAIPFRKLCELESVNHTTGLRWMDQRKNMGNLAMRSTRKVSQKLGRQSKVTKKMAQMLVNPKLNPVRDQLYEAQIEYHQLPVKKRQLQRKLKEFTRGGRRYKMAFVKKQVSDKN